MGAGHSEMVVPRELVASCNQRTQALWRCQQQLQEVQGLLKEQRQEMEKVAIIAWAALLVTWFLWIARIASPVLRRWLIEHGLLDERHKPTPTPAPARAAPRKDAATSTDADPDSDPFFVLSCSALASRQPGRGAAWRALSSNELDFRSWLGSREHADVLLQIKLKPSRAAGAAGTWAGGVDTMREPIEHVSAIKAFLESEDLEAPASDSVVRGFHVGSRVSSCGAGMSADGDISGHIAIDASSGSMLGTAAAQADYCRSCEGSSKVLQTYHAHSLVLATRSTHFDTLLSTCPTNSPQQPASGCRSASLGNTSHEGLIMDGHGCSCYIEESTCHLDVYLMPHELPAFDLLLRLMYGYDPPSAATTPAPGELPLLFQCLGLADRFGTSDCVDLLLGRLQYIDDITTELMQHVFSAPPGVKDNPAFWPLEERCRRCLLLAYCHAPEVIQAVAVRREFRHLPLFAVLATAQAGRAGHDGPQGSCAD